MEQIHDDLRPRYVKLDELVTNPGLEHIALHIFKYLDPKSVGQCRAVSKGWKSLIDNDKFWWMQILDGKMIIYNNLIFAADSNRLAILEYLTSLPAMIN